MKVILLFKSFGPYHLARLAALRKTHEVLALEAFGVDVDYDWGMEARKRAAGVESLQARSVSGLMKSLLAACDGFAPDVIVTPGWGEMFSLAAIAVANLNSIPVVLMSDSRLEDAPRSLLKEAFKRFVVSLSDAAFVAGSPHRAYLLGLGMDQGRIRDGYDVVDNDHFDTRHRGPKGRDDPPYLVCCARFVDKKNLLFLVNAFARFRTEAGSAWRLLLVGDGPMRAQLQERIASLAAEEFVVLAGKKTYDELPDIYRSAEALVMPSTTDQWGLVVNEAMAAGLPVVVSSGCGCAPDLVMHGVNGFIFDPADMAAAVAALRQLAQADRVIMGAASREIIARWDLRRFAENLGAACELACDARRGRAATYGFVGALALTAAARMQSRG